MVRRHSKQLSPDDGDDAVQWRERLKGQLRRTREKLLDHGVTMASSFEDADHVGAPFHLLVQPLQRVRNRYKIRGAEVLLRILNRGVWCDRPGQRHREHEGAGRPIHMMSCELVLVAGRLCDSPGCAVSANP